MVGVQTDQVRSHILFGSIDYVHVFVVLVTDGPGLQYFFRVCVCVVCGGRCCGFFLMDYDLHMLSVDLLGGR